MSESEEKVAPDVAKHEFHRFLEKMDIDVDPTGWDDEDKRSFAEAERRVVGAIVSGRLAIDESGCPVFSPGKGDPITFYEPTGATLMAMDQKKRGHDNGKMMAAMADMTRESIKRYAAMPHRDLKLCLSIVALFMGG